MARLSDLLRHSHVAPDSAGDVEPPPAQIDADVCQECGGVGFVRRDVPITDAEFGRAIQCRCVDNESQRDRQDRLQNYSNLGPLTRLTFDNLIARGRSADPRDQSRFQRCVEDAEAFAKDPQGWLVMIGASGCGKTHIAAAIANRCLELGTPALFVVMPDLLDHLRAAYRPDADVTYDELFEQVRNAPVLILDDLGTQSATPWAEEKLFQIINHRFNARLPTVVTTNTPLRKLDDRLRTRLGDPSLSQPHADLIANVHELEDARPPEYRELNMLELPGIQEMTFESFDLLNFRSPRDRENRDNAYRLAMEFAAEPVKWMAYLSGTSRDRTHLLAAIGNYRRRLAEPALLVRVGELLDLLRQSMFSEDMDYYEVKKNIRGCPLLLLDELEIGIGSENSRKELFDLLKWRFDSRLPTVFSSSSQRNQLLSYAGWRPLAQLMNAPNFCSEVTVGEDATEEDVSSPKPSDKKPSAKRSNKRN